MNVVGRVTRWLLLKCLGRKLIEALIKRTANLLQIDLVRVAYQSIGVLNYETHVLSGEAFLTTRVLPRLIDQDRPVILDVGANIGEISLAMRRAFPMAEIWAFEPNPVTFRALEEKLQGSRVNCQPLGVGAAPGEATLHCYSGDQTSGHASIYGGVFDLYAEYGVAGADRLTTFVFPVTTIDTFCRQRDIQKIDFLKIDVEGHELAVLQGAAESLLAGRIGAIQFEFTDCNVMSRVFMRDFYALLPGYQLFRLNTFGLVPMSNYRTRYELFQYQNILAVREERVAYVEEFTRGWVEGQ